MRIVDDFPLGDQPGRGFGKLLEQHDCQGKIAAGEYAKMLFARKCVNLLEVTFCETRRSYDDMCTVLESGQDIRLCAIWLGVLDKDVAWMRQRLCGRGVNATGKARLAQYVA
jgi:hypothetical protein